MLHALCGSQGNADAGDAEHLFRIDAKINGIHHIRVCTEDGGGGGGMEIRVGKHVLTECRLCEWCPAMLGEDTVYVARALLLVADACMRPLCPRVCAFVCECACDGVNVCVCARARVFVCVFGSEYE